MNKKRNVLKVEAIKCRQRSTSDSGPTSSAMSPKKRANNGNIQSSQGKDKVISKTPVSVSTMEPSPYIVIPKAMQIKDSMKSKNPIDQPVSPLVIHEMPIPLPPDEDMRAIPILGCKPPTALNQWKSTANEENKQKRSDNAVDIVVSPSPVLPLSSQMILISEDTKSGISQQEEKQEKKTKSKLNADSKPFIPQSLKHKFDLETGKPLSHHNDHDQSSEHSLQMKSATHGTSTTTSETHLMQHGSLSAVHPNPMDLYPPPPPSSSDHTLSYAMGTEAWFNNATDPDLCTSWTNEYWTSSPDGYTSHCYRTPMISAYPPSSSFAPPIIPMSTHSNLDSNTLESRHKVEEEKQESLITFHSNNADGDDYKGRRNVSTILDIDLQDIGYEAVDNPLTNYESQQQDKSSQENEDDDQGLWEEAQLQAGVLPIEVAYLRLKMSREKKRCEQKKDFDHVPHTREDDDGEGPNSPLIASFPTHVGTTTDEFDADADSMPLPIDFTAFLQ
ncbi:hypothetical protein RFI_22992 [Reticulomyxa filosa]|uniref:Uncharacterized protein n=1 Tax=Reticulomyxa filosa TaxID=46433 RepID=X6MKM9_RETFI|nr:hypothetical protein RFI_22992 [Reticulomyxa filosa]|eukprot:ETO14379.1 hypothetical protein RFI_22992 [Reticulomyxa filosa]